MLQRVDQALEAGEGEDQSALISSLRERIQALEAEIERLQKEAATPPTPTPVPVPTPTPTPTPVGVVTPAIQDLIDKLPKHPTNRYNTRKLSAIDTLVVHHSAVPPTVGPQRMADYHVKNLEWPGLGYHFMVGEDGIVYQGNHLKTVSYHTGNANGHCVGICFLGNFTNSVPPPEQLRAGAHLVAWLMQELDIELDNVKGHKEMLATQCPGKQWLEGKKWKQMLRREIAAVQQEAAQPAPTPTPVPVPEGGKTLYHYLLFWSHDGKWGDRDWAVSYTHLTLPTNREV